MAKTKKKRTVIAPCILGATFSVVTACALAVGAPSAFAVPGSLGPVTIPSSDNSSPEHPQKPASGTQDPQ